MAKLATWKLAFFASLACGALAATACSSSSDDTEEEVGSGGTSGTGASSSTGGTGPGGAPGTGGGATGSACDEGNKGTSTAAGTCALINDFEGDAETFGASVGLNSDGRVSAGIDNTYGGKDSSGTGDLEVVDDAGNKVLKFTFTGAKEWGGSFAYLLTNAECYDVSAYTGISFKAKVAGSDEKLFVGIGEAATNPFYDCAADKDAAGLCYDHPRKSFDLAVADGWKEFSFTWADFKSPGWGANGSNALDPATAVSVIFADFGTDLENNEIELYVDDLSFTGGDNSSCDAPTEGGGGAGGAN